MQVQKQILANRQINLGPLAFNSVFLGFLETVPAVLAGLLDRTLTLRTLVEAQYRCLDKLATLSCANETIIKLRDAHSQYEQAEAFVAALGSNEQMYCMKTPGMTYEEYSAMCRGDLTVGRLLRQNPAVILAPLFRPRLH